jgi:hypothetical protein
MNANSNGSTKPIEWFVNSLLQIAGELMLIIDHMARHPSPESEERFDAVLRRLLSETLAQELDHEPAQYAGAAVLLAEVRGAIEENIFLVDPDAFGDEELNELELEYGDDEEDAA